MVTPRTGRPRGRPKGSKNVPSVEAFVLDSLTTDIPAPQLPAPKKRRGSGPWANKTPAERTAYALKLREAKDPANNSKAGRPKGLPYGFTVAQFEAAKAAQQPIIDRIMKKMSDKGQLPDDPRAEEALRETVTVLRTPGLTPKDKLAAARLILDFTKTRPTTKVEHTVKTAEDLLDEMADE